MSTARTTFVIRPVPAGGFPNLLAFVDDGLLPAWVGAAGRRAYVRVDPGVPLPTAGFPACLYGRAYLGYTSRNVVRLRGRPPRRHLYLAGCTEVAQHIHYRRLSVLLAAPQVLL